MIHCVFFFPYCRFFYFSIFYISKVFSLTLVSKFLFVFYIHIFSQSLQLGHGLTMGTNPWKRFPYIQVSDVVCYKRIPVIYRTSLLQNSRKYLLTQFEHMVLESPTHCRHFPAFSHFILPNILSFRTLNYFNLLTKSVSWILITLTMSSLPRSSSFFFQTPSDIWILLYHVWY